MSDRSFITPQAAALMRSWPGDPRWCHWLCLPGHLGGRPPGALSLVDG